MTVIVFDGKIFAADKQATSDGLAVMVTKIFKIDESRFAATCGDRDCGRLLVDWYAAGENREQWPSFQAKDSWTTLVVVEFGKLYYYQQECKKLDNEMPFFAYGAGRDFAIGAMAAGKNAIQAVEIANTFSTICGFGVDYFEVGGGE